jgi:hypothetical protein
MKRISSLFSLLNVILAVIGITIIGISIWIKGISNNGTSIYQTFFQTYIVMTSLFGTLLIILPFVGSMGIQYSALYIGSPNRIWTAKRIFILYVLVSLFILIAEIFYLYEAFLAYKEMTHANKQITSYSDDYVSMTSISNIPLGTYEKILSNQFNIYYWGAAQECNNRYTLFWSWINSNCNDGISSTNCKKCNDYSVQLCEVDYETCTSISSSACPYISCRSNIIKYIVDNIMPLSYWILAFTILQFLLITIAIIIIYNVKSGRNQNRTNNNNNRMRSS